MITTIIFALVCFSAYLIWLQFFTKKDVAHNLYYSLCERWGLGEEEDDIVLWLINTHKVKPLEALTLATIAKANA